MGGGATSSDRSRARQSHTVSRPTIAAVMAETIVGPADPRSLRSPKLTPRLNPRTRLKEGSTGITRGGFITQASIAHLEARSRAARSEEDTTELQSLMRHSYAVFFRKK